MTTLSVPTVSEVVEYNVNNDKHERNSPLILWCRTHWCNILSEFVSTLMLLLFGCMTCLPITVVKSAIYSSLGFGMVVMFNVQIFGHISGAHMNPAVTLATVIWGTTSVPVGIAYFIVQCAGSIVGYGIFDALTSIDLVENAVCVTQPFPGQSVIQSFGVEMAITVALILIVCALLDPVNQEKQDSASIKFGLTIVGLSLVGGPLTGASMNPARTLGPAIWTNIWTDHWVYWAGPICGSILAANLYKFIFLKKPKG